MQFTMRLWGSLLLAGLASGAVLSRSDTSNNALAACPGYKASNVKTSNNGLTAQLSLAGKACNVYGNDLKDLILEVTYENGKSCLNHRLLPPSLAYTLGLAAPDRFSAASHKPNPPNLSMMLLSQSSPANNTRQPPTCQDPRCRQSSLPGPRLRLPTPLGQVGRLLQQAEVLIQSQSLLIYCRAPRHG